MNQSIRTILKDPDLGLEAVRLEGLAQDFPVHMHDYYVIGLMENGNRLLHLASEEIQLKQGDLLILNPGDVHGCRQESDQLMVYSCIQIRKERMKELVEDGFGLFELPVFTQTVIHDDYAKMLMEQLQEALWQKHSSADKETCLILLADWLMEHAQTQSGIQPEKSETPILHAKAIENVCTYMEANYEKPLSLQDFCLIANLSKSTLLRAFAAEKGMTPYLFLQSLRIKKAQNLLAGQIPVLEAALSCGFSDQSHFSNVFRRFTGLSPGAYRSVFLSEASAASDPPSSAQPRTKSEQQEG